MDAKPPRGLHVLTCGHSFHVWVAELLRELAATAGIAGHEIVHVSAIGGSTVLQHWEVPEAGNLAKAALSAARADVLTLSPIWLPDAGIERFVRFAIARNPGVRVTVQEYWLPNDSYEPIYPLQVGKPVDHDATDLAWLRGQHDAYDRDVDACIRALNAELGKDAVLAVPAGQAALTLRERIRAGRAPGLRRDEDLFTDSWGHPSETLRVLAAYCHFGVLYRRSPEGLPPPEELRRLARPGTDELNRLLQELAWASVIAHPLSGVKAPGAESRA